QLFHTRDGKLARDVPPGPANSWDAYGLPWANASNTPFRLYKSWLGEGGIASPFIVRHPSFVQGAGGIRDDVVAHTIDLMPTFLALAGAEMPAPDAKRGAYEGIDLSGAFRGEKLERPRPLVWNQWGGHAVRDGRWKLILQGAEATTNRLTRYLYD